MKNGKRIRFAGIVRDRARFHGNVGAFGQGEQPGQMGKSLVIDVGPHETQMVDNKSQIGIALGNRVDQRE